MCDLKLALCAAVFVGLSVSAIAQGAATQWKTFDFPGAIETDGTSITSFGEIGGQYTTADGIVHGFTWREGQYTSIDFPGAFWTLGTWLNDRGEIVGAYGNGTNHAFLLEDGHRGQPDLGGLSRRHSHGRLIRNQDDGAVVRALPEEMGRHQPVRGLAASRYDWLP
jgi:hypothetical protein